MKIGLYVLRDKYGWPVESTKHHPVSNFLRALIHTNIVKTFFRKRREL